MNLKLKLKKNKVVGQSLVELILAIALGVVFIGVAALVVAPLLKINTETNEAKVAGTWARELMENVRLWSEGNWPEVNSLNRGEHFYLSTSTSVFASSTGVESIVIGTTTYQRSFSISDVCRNDFSGSIVKEPELCTSGLDVPDPSVLKVIVDYAWSPEYATKTFSALISRNKNRLTTQTDWSAGSGETGPVFQTSGYNTSNNISATSTPGTLIIQGFQ